jgi:hypothetical protein
MIQVLVPRISRFKLRRVDNKVNNAHKALPRPTTQGSSVMQSRERAVCATGGRQGKKIVDSVQQIHPRLRYKRRPSLRLVLFKPSAIT